MRKAVYKVVSLKFESAIIMGDYNLEYEIGKVVKAIPDSLGIFCFKTLKDATGWYYKGFGRGTTIIKVRPMGRERIPKEINQLDIFQTIIYGQTTTLIPKGTICYPAVKVLEVVQEVQ